MPDANPIRKDSVGIEEGITHTPSNIVSIGANDDEARYGTTHIGSFSKGLPHNDCGEVDHEAFERFVAALDNGRFREFGDAHGKEPGRFVDPSTINLCCADPFALRSAPAIDGAESAAEMVELYWMALLRDVPFLDWETGAPSGIDEAAREISAITQFTGPRRSDGKQEITPRSLFRGVEKSSCVGPYVSQFLLRDVPSGSLTTVQRQRTVVPDRNFLTRWDEYLAVQNGSRQRSPTPFDATPRYIRSLRDLGQYVRADEPFQCYLNACRILLADRTPVKRGNRCAGVSSRDSRLSAPVGADSWRAPHILTLISEVADRAQRAIAWQKWFVHRRPRPERYGALLERQRDCGYCLSPSAMESEAVRRVQAAYGTRLLPVQFPEGAPSSPSYGSAHAAIAGACVTLLKAWFVEGAPLSRPPMVASTDGTELVSYDGADAGAMTVGGELNKLASNMAMACCAAGVQWRSDCYEALRLGERIAVELLVSGSRDLHEAFSLTFTSFDGRIVRINGAPDRSSISFPLHDTDRTSITGTGRAADRPR